MAAKSDTEHYFSERAREAAEVRDKADIEAAEVAVVFQSYGLTAEESKPIVDALRKRPRAWVNFMMRFELGLEKPDPKRAVISAGTRRFHSARSVSYSPDDQYGAYPIGDYYSDHPSHFWLHQRLLYRRAATS